MLEQSKVEQDLLKWIEEFVEKPHPALGGWPPCPYARQARLSSSFLVMQGTTPEWDVEDLHQNYDWSKEVVVLWYQPDHDGQEFVDRCSKIREKYIEHDLAVLEGHPDVDEILSGIRMNFDTCPIIIVQKLDELNEAADKLKDKGYYEHWNDEMLDRMVNWRYKK